MKFAIIWSTVDPPIYSADGALINQQIEIVDKLEKFSRVYRDEVKEEILKFEKESQPGESLHMSKFGYIAAPVIRRIE